MIKSLTWQGAFAAILLGIALPAWAQAPLGTVTITNPSVACPSGAAIGAACAAVAVTCPGTNSINATVAVATPASPVGTILMHDGKMGTTLFNHGFPPAYLARGFRTVQMAWI